MDRYFQRQIELWGEEKQSLLSEKRVAIIGCGGLGSSLALALGSSGIGTIFFVDYDKIELHNIHRQIAFKIDDIGEYKAKIVSKLIKKRYSQIESIPKIMDFDEFSKENLNLDLLIDATDNLQVRAKIDQYAKRENLTWIYGSVEEFNGQVCMFDKSDFSAFKINKNRPKGIAAPIVMHIASLQANLALRFLAGLSVKKDMLYYLYFDDSGELITQKFNMPKSNKHG